MLPPIVVSKERKPTGVLRFDPGMLSRAFLVAAILTAGAGLVKLSKDSPAVESRESMLVKSEVVLAQKYQGRVTASIGEGEAPNKGKRTDRLFSPGR